MLGLLYLTDAMADVTTVIDGVSYRLYRNAFTVFDYTGDGECNVQDYVTYDNITYPVTQVKLESNIYLRSLTMGQSITTVTVKDCQMLTDLYMHGGTPANNTRLTIQDCPKLKVTELDSYLLSAAFTNCYELQEVSFLQGCNQAEFKSCNALTTVSGSLYMTLTACSNISNITTLTSSASISMSGHHGDMLTLSGKGGRLSMSSDCTTGHVVIDGVLAYVQAQDSQVTDVTLTAGVDSVYSIRIPAVCNLELENDDFGYINDSAFRDCYVKRIAVTSNTNKNALNGARIGRLDVSERLNYSIKDIASVDTLFVGNDVYTYERTSGPVPKYIEGGKLRSIIMKNMFSISSCDQIYDFDGDGRMSIVSDTSVKNEVAFFDADTLTRKVNINYDNSRPVIVHDYDNSGEGTLFSYSSSSTREYDNFYKYGKNGELSKQDLPGHKYLFDANNDGLPDLFSRPYLSSDYIIYRQTPEHAFVRTDINMTTNKEEVYTSPKPSGSWADNIPSLGIGWMIGGYTETVFDNITTATDLTKDGMPELIDTEKGGILYHLDGNNYYASYERGIIKQCDINGDGALDYILFDNTNGAVYLMIYQDGEYTSKMLVENMNITDAYCVDIDRDGDVDILLPFDYDKNAGYSFLLLYCNDGNGVFKKKEYSFTAKYTFGLCRDMDADGMYEVLAFEQDNEGNSNRAVSIRCNSDFSLGEPEILTDFLNSSYGMKGFAAGDFDNDGYSECYITGISCRILADRSRQNTPPAQMEKPAAYYDNSTGKLRISWKKGTDAQTSSCDLTYQLRIGTGTGKGDILSGNALSDGRRVTPHEGNMGHNLYTLFNTESLQPGKYYISVQAVDGGSLGGPWSEELVYEHGMSPVQFVMNVTDMTTLDTLQLTAPKYDGTETAYAWDVADGSIIEAVDNTAKVVFRNRGKKDITLTISKDGEDIISQPQTVNVRIAKHTYGTTDPNRFCIMADFDSDGYPDYLGLEGVFSNNGKGEFSKVGRTFNSDLKGTLSGIMDFNKDGYPDFFTDSKKGNVFINTGEGDCDFEYSTKVFTIEDQYGTEEGNPNVYLWTDFNNDGHLDGFSPVLFNKGDDLNYWKSSIKLLTVADVNRDGLPDMITESSDYANKEYNVSVFIKDTTSQHNYMDPVVMFRTEYDYRNYTHLVEDFDNDGYLDLAMFSFDKEYNIIFIKGLPEEQWPAEEMIRVPVKGDFDFGYNHTQGDVLRDYDNNGYYDILINASDKEDSMEKYTKAILFMKQGFQFDMERSSLENNKLFMPLADDNVIQMDFNKALIDNLAPQAPTNVTARQIKGGIQIAWDDAVDDHTPAVHMRYNISVRKKGATGDNSFIISPMNGNYGKASVVSNIIYHKGNRMIVPSDVLEAGTTYEIQVQAIDMLNAVSDMSKTTELTVSADGYIDIQGKVRTGNETAMRYVGTKASTFDIDLDGGTMVKDNGDGSYIVRWDTGGIKRPSVTVNGKRMETCLTVVDAADLTFTLPENILAGAPASFEVPDVLCDPASDGGFRSDSEQLEIIYGKGDSTAYVTASATGKYTIIAYLNDPLSGNTRSVTFEVKDTMPDAHISKVEIDDKTGKYIIVWPTGNIPSYISSAVVCRETNRADIFVPVDTVDARQGYVIDMMSLPEVKTERYRMYLIAGNGQTSGNSETHTPLHVMINIAASGKYNLMWNPYEGLDVESYTVLRGTSDNDMQEIARVSGNTASYTDTDAPEGELLYAVSIVPKEKATSAKAKSTETGQEIHSNIVSTKDALTATFAEDIRIYCMEETVELNNSNGTLHLFAEITPQNATFANVTWSITEGSGLAQINKDGLLTRKGSGEGEITIRATATDGSGVYAETRIAVKNTGSDVDSIMAEDSNNWQLKAVYDSGNSTLTLSGWPENRQAQIYIVSAGGILMKIVRTDEAEVTIPCNGFAAGIYAVKVISAGRSDFVKFANRR